MNVSICLVSMNRPATLAATLAALLERSVMKPEIVIVDNGSTDEETLDVLNQAEIRYQARVIRNATNLGLSVAVNQGLERATGDILIHLDDDAVVQTRGWDQVFSDYCAIPEVGVAFAHGAGAGIPKRVSRPSLPGLAYHEVTWGLGFCWAMGREVYETIGGYDPQLLHQNECDLALRARLAGYDAAGLSEIQVLHNDPGGPRSEHSLAREHLGCVQFRDKWGAYFRGPNWNYGTQPLYLMQHWPPDQDFFRRYAESRGVWLNPEPGKLPNLGPGATLGITDETLATIEDQAQHVIIDGQAWLVFRELRSDYAHWDRGAGYVADRDWAIARWKELTGEAYTGYRWPEGRLKP